MENHNGYSLSRAWFNWSFENPDLITPAHSAIYFFAIEHCNRLGWKDKFGFPSQMVMEAIGIKKHHTYIKYFDDLCDWGFFELVEKSSNQYSSNIISIQSALLKNGKALDKALATHTAKHTAKQGQSTRQSSGCIDKQLTTNNKQLTTNIDAAAIAATTEVTLWPSFSDFWDKYDKREDKIKCEKKWKKISQGAREKIMAHLELYIASTPEKTFRKNPMTYLNNESWENEVIFKPQQNGKQQLTDQIRAGIANIAAKYGN